MDLIPGIVCMSWTGFEFSAQRYCRIAVAVAVAGGETGAGLNRYSRFESVIVRGDSVE